MEKQIMELSVFFPAYNEQTNIQATVQQAKKVLEQIASRWEIIIVNDGSTDNTRVVVQGLVDADKRIRLINHFSNKGYGEALKSGFYNSKYAWIAFTDSDGQFDFSDIKHFIQRQKDTKADLVIGYYKSRQVSLFTKLTSKIWEFLVFVLFGLKVKDIDCGFKLISKSVIQKIKHLDSSRGAFISSELLIKAKKAGFRIVELPVTHHPRLSGKATGRNLKVIVQSFRDLLRLRMKLT